MTVTDIERKAGVFIALFVLAASVYLIAPFSQPMFWAGLMVMTTWPLMIRLNALWHKPLLNAGILTFLWSFLVIAPLIGAVLLLSGDAKVVIAKAMTYVNSPLPDLPKMVTGLPAIGSLIEKNWSDLQAMGNGWFDQVKPYISKTISMAVAQTANVGKILFNVSLTLLFAFLFYWEGEKIVDFGHKVIDRVAGSKSREYIAIVTSTLQNVMNGIVGTALAQAALALIGFAIAGVPGALLLGVATFFLALIPMGPPLIWVPACAWLFYQGDVGWAIALAIWGTVIISGVDNVLKPLLISRGSVLPLPLVLLGVFGGVLNFGFIGIFIGPAVIALGYTLIKIWMDSSHLQADVAKTDNES